MRPVLSFAILVLTLQVLHGAEPATASDVALEQQFAGKVRPFLETYCLSCHGTEKQEAELNLSSFSTVSSVIDGFSYWELVLERLEPAEMPPSKAKKHPTDAQREEVIAWIQALRKNEAHKRAGDPGPVLARRLSNAEYDYSIRDLTGVEIRPTREFPIDPANQAGFDNSGESLAMSPALVKKYLQAARTVAEHLILKPEGFTFAPHPVVADTDRDKYAVLRIVDFYKRQPTDYADYFQAAWRFQHRAALGKPNATLADFASEAKLSAKYLTTIWATLNERNENVGPIAKLQAEWRRLPTSDSAAIRGGCEQMRDSVVALREKLVPEVKNLTAPQINNGSQTLVLWKNRQMAANRRRYDPGALQTAIDSAAKVGADLRAVRDDVAPEAKSAKMPAAATQQPSSIPDAVRKGGKFLPPAIVTTGSSATFQMAAAKRRADDPDLIVPADPEERAKYEAAFARFASVFPDAFYITERARVYLDAAKEQSNAGRLLSAGLHSMTGYFRDDGPLYDLVLDDPARRELDRLWREFEFASSVPQRMHISFAWFERTDSSFMRDAEFDPFRPEDKSVTDQAKIKKLGELYLAKAAANKASETAQMAIKEHFERVAVDILRVEQDRIAAEPTHLDALLRFAERAWRRPLSTDEREKVLRFYRTSRHENGVDHEEAMRDCIVSVLMSPNFSYRIDLIEVADGWMATSGRRQTASAVETAPGGRVPRQSNYAPLSNHALASRLSYFLWSSIPDAELLTRAAAGDLQKPEVLAAQARRMLKDDRAMNFAKEFAGHWLDFRRFEEHNAVDRERFPGFDNDLRTAMFEEPLRFFLDIVCEDRSVLNFLYGDYTFVNAPLAKHYGMPFDNVGRVPSPGAGERTVRAPHPQEADEWIRIDHAERFGRGGLLPMAVFLTANSPGLRTSPVKRGYWVVRRVLGERIPPPPAVVPDLPNDEKNLGDLTLRQVLAKHREDKSCASCHARFDSFGLVFEGFGPVGEQRARDFGGRAVDAHAEFPGGREGTGVAGLRDYIRSHREKDFVDNLCRKLVAFALGRTLLMSDDALIAEMKTKLAANDYRFGALIDCIVTSPQFRTKRPPFDSEKTALVNR
jgi:hypothetical protein